jgi:hypothetical protein
VYIRKVFAGPQGIISASLNEVIDLSYFMNIFLLKFVFVSFEAFFIL